MRDLRIVDVAKPTQRYVTHSAEETIELGRKLAGEMHEPQLILLIGDLAAGKTTLAKGLISGLGAARIEDVLSPTFTLIHEYGENPKVFHIDLYRLDRIRELESLGLDDLWDEPAIVIIEWGEKFAAQLPGERVEIHIRETGDEDREIEVAAM